MMNVIQDEVLPEQFQETLELPKRCVEELANQERYHQVPLAHRRSAGALLALPERECGGQFPDALHRQMNVPREPAAVSSTARYELVASRPRFDQGLSGKSEYFVVYEDVGGVHLVHLA